MNKSKFIVGEKYIYTGTRMSGHVVTYVCADTCSGGIFKNSLLERYSYQYKNMAPYKQPKPKYPNPPLPHCEERIAFAKGANIESSITNNGPWCFVADPEWQPHLRYRVKVEKTKDDLRIEELERRIAEDLRILNMHKKELADLKPTVHY
jgi:hypothetical protein